MDTENENLIKRNKIYHYLLEELKKNNYVYSKSSEHYKYMNFYMLIPSLFLGSLASILSFISSSSLLTDDDKTYTALFVGAITTLSTLLQTISNTIGFALKYDLFEKAANEYSKLIIKVEFEMLAPNEEHQEFVNNIEEQMNKIQQSCKYFPPRKIIDSYSKRKIDLNDDDDSLREIIYHQ